MSEKRNITIGEPWFIERMTNDFYVFTIATTSGELFYVRRILAVSRIGTSHWIDVELCTENEIGGLARDSLFPNKEDKTTASINLDNVVSASELLRFKAKSYV